MNADALSRCTILMIDDEEANLDLLEALLAPDGYVLVRVSDPRTAVSAFERFRPDLVLLDLHMPAPNGFTILDEIRCLTPADEYLPVLVLTADVTMEARERALSGGAKDFLVKPLDAVEVCLRVRNLLETRLLHREQRAAREAAEAAERRAILLADASRVLASVLDRTTTLGQLPPLLVPDFAALCIVHVLENGRHVPVGIADADPVRERTVRALLNGGSHADENDGAWMARLRDTVGDAAVLHTSLTAGSERVGMLTLVRDAPFNVADEALAGELALRAGVAVDNARLMADAQCAAQARDRVLAAVAHDLRNPLASIAANAETLRNLLPPRASARQRQGLARIEQVAQQTHGLVQDLLDIARHDHHGLDVRLCAVEPLPLFDEAEMMLQPLAAARAVTLAFSGSCDVAPILADPSRVVQVLSNLVGNSLKFTPADGRVDVRWRTEGDEFIVEVADTGTGIPVDRVPRLFGGNWSKDPSDWQGAGLGLVIARAIIEAHGGRIWLESPPGAGATFTFSLKHAARVEVP